MSTAPNDILNIQGLQNGEKITYINLPGNGEVILAKLNNHFIIKDLKGTVLLNTTDPATTAQAVQIMQDNGIKNFVLNPLPKPDTTNFGIEPGKTFSIDGNNVIVDHLNPNGTFTIKDGNTYRYDPYDHTVTPADPNTPTGAPATFQYDPSTKLPEALQKNEWDLNQAQNQLDEEMKKLQVYEAAHPEYDSTQKWVKLDAAQQKLDAHWAEQNQVEALYQGLPDGTDLSKVSLKEMPLGDGKPMLGLQMPDGTIKLENGGTYLPQSQTWYDASGQVHAVGGTTSSSGFKYDPTSNISDELQRQEWQLDQSQKQLDQQVSELQKFEAANPTVDTTSQWDALDKKQVDLDTMGGQLTKAETQTSGGKGFLSNIMNNPAFMGVFALTSAFGLYSSIKSLAQKFSVTGGLGLLTTLISTYQSLKGFLGSSMFKNLLGGFLKGHSGMIAGIAVAAIAAMAFIIGKYGKKADQTLATGEIPGTNTASTGSSNSGGTPASAPVPWYQKFASTTNVFLLAAGTAALSIGLNLNGGPQTVHISAQMVPQLQKDLSVATGTSLPSDLTGKVFVSPGNPDKVVYVTRDTNGSGFTVQSINLDFNGDLTAPSPQGFIPFFMQLSNGAIVPNPAAAASLSAQNALVQVAASSKVSTRSSVAAAFLANAMDKGGVTFNSRGVSTSSH